MSISTGARDVGDGINLLKSNERFYRQIEEPFSLYINSSSKESREIRDLLESQQEIANLSDDELQESISKLENRINVLKVELNNLLFSQSKDKSDRIMEIQVELNEKKASLSLLNNEFNVRKRVDTEINSIKETLKPENTPENMKRLSQLDKSRDSRLDKARDEEFDSISKDIHKRYEDIRTAYIEEIKELASMQVKYILDLYRREKLTNKEEIYEAINELLTKKLDNEELDDIIFNTVWPLIKKHSELFEIWNSYNENQARKNENPEPDPNKGDGDGDDEIEDEEIDDDKKDDPEEEQDDEKDKKPTDIQPNVNAKWRTIASIAAGIGLGASVWFGFGAAGVAVLTIGGGIAKRLLAKKQAQLQELKQNGQLKIHKADDFPKTLVGQLQRFRSYINSPEGLDAVQKVLTSSILTSVGFNIFGPMLGLEGGQVISAIKGLSSTAATSTPTVDTNAVANANPTQTGVQTGDLRVGDSVGNLTTGYTDSINAASGTNTVSLNQNLINNDTSQIGSFLVRKGSESFTINDPSLTISDIVDKYGVAETDIVANVVQSGTLEPQSWNPLTDIANAKNAINTLGQGGRAI